MELLFYLDGSGRVERVGPSHKPENYDHFTLLEKKYVDDNGAELDLIWTPGTYELPACLFLGIYD